MNAIMALPNSAGSCKYWTILVGEDLLCGASNGPGRVSGECLAAFMRKCLSVYDVWLSRLEFLRVDVRQHVSI